jgi:hypothetical protein
MFDLYPRSGHRTPQQIAEDAGGSFEPKTAGRSSAAGAGAGQETHSKPTVKADDGVTETLKRGR